VKAKIVGDLRRALKVPTGPISFYTATVEIAQALNVPNEAATMILYGLCATENVRAVDGRGVVVDGEVCTLRKFFEDLPPSVCASDVRDFLRQWSPAPQPEAREAVIREMLAEGKVPPRDVSWKLFRNELRKRCKGWLASGKPAHGFSDKQIDRTVKRLMDE
jgi:hypothetical protein